MDKIDQKIVDRIEEYGWYAISVAPAADSDDPEEWFTYTAGAHSIFTGNKLLTTANAGDDKDAALFAKLGLTAMKAEEPMRAAPAH